MTPHELACLIEQKAVSAAVETFYKELLKEMAEVGLNPFILAETVHSHTASMIVENLEPAMPMTFTVDFGPIVSKTELLKAIEESDPEDGWRGTIIGDKVIGES